MTDRSCGWVAAIRELEAQVEAARDGWPEEMFLFVSRITPLVNVDLLIQDDRGRTLLTWRRDEFYGPGWHVPGGVIRFKEAAADRIRIVAERELSAAVDFDASPILVQESIIPGQRDRGHFISLLYRCRLVSGPEPLREHSQEAPQPGQWRWHDGCPGDLIPEQQSYATFMR